jgi:hypothetical protein
MAILPTPEQLSNMDSKLTVAINFVVCPELTPNDLQSSTIPDGNSDYAILKSNFEPIKTNTLNYSIDFLPDHEYTLFRVTSTIDVIDPQCVLPQSRLPTKVRIFQGNTQDQATVSYTPGLITEFPIPLPSAHSFPIIYNSDNKPIIYDQQNGTIKPFTTLAAQQLFKNCCAANPWTYPNNPTQLWCQPTPVYHVTDDPKTIPLSLADMDLMKSSKPGLSHTWTMPCAILTFKSHTIPFPTIGNNIITLSIPSSCKLIYPP